MDIVAIRNAIDTLMPFLNPTQTGNLEAMIGQGIIDFHEKKAETNYENDLKQLGIDMKLNTRDFESPF